MRWFVEEYLRSIGSNDCVNKRIIAILVIGIVVTILATDLIIDALTPSKSLAFTYRLIANICTVAIFGIIYWWKKWLSKEKTITSTNSKRQLFENYLGFYNFYILYLLPSVQLFCLGVFALWQYDCNLHIRRRHCKNLQRLVL